MQTVSTILAEKKLFSLGKCVQYAVCCAAVFVIALEAIHTGFYFHNDFLIRFQPYVNSFFSLWFLLIFCSIYCSFSLSAYSKRGLSKLKWLRKLGIQFLHLVPGYFWLIYQLFKPMSVAFVFWSLLERQCLTLSLCLCYGFFLIEVREWWFHCVIKLLHPILISLC